MNLADLNKVALAMVTPGKGILAADESSGTIKKRFDAIKVDSTEENRRDYREMLFRSTEAMSKYVSGVILYDETIWQNAKDGTPLVKLIEQAGAIPGIKVDEGTQALPQCPGELVTVGLDKLAERLKKYYERGARFAKWRAVIDIGSGVPTMTAISVNAHALARYAALCQAAQIVPIVEPEVLMDGDHDVQRCEDVTTWMLKETFQELFYAHVALEGISEALLGVRDDVQLRGALQRYVDASKLRLRLDNAVEVEGARARAEDALEQVSHPRDPRRQAQVLTLLGILAYRASASGGAQSQVDAAISDFSAALRADPASEQAAFDLELLLRLTAAHGSRVEPGQGGGFGRTGHRGAGGGQPGSGY